MLRSGRPVVMAIGDGRTKQEFKHECDVNTIIRRFVRDGFLVHMAKGTPKFLDVSEIGDYRTAIDQVRAAEEYFGNLPAKVRAKFGNDAARFLDEAGKLSRDELRELGLVELRKDDRPKRRRADLIEDPSGTSAPEGSGTVTS